LGEPFFGSIIDNDDLTLNQLGITMVSTPTSQQVTEIMTLVAESLKAGKNGMIGINTADALLISSTVREGNLELAAWYLSLAEERARVKNEEAQMRMSQMNAENQMKSSQASEQMKAQTQQILSQLKQTEEGAKIAAQLEADLTLKEVEHQYTMEELALEGSIQASTGREVKGRI
jgi:cell division septum initiation protein DivIVA